MTTDNKTLADVQPGGRVRLGDALPPLPCTGYSAYSDGTEPLYTAEQMQNYARAALSAQPSPGGQDVLFIEELAELRRLVPSVNQKHALDAAIAALAARQPVGADWQHIANEWADATANGVQWLRNIRDGASTVADALACMESNVERIQQLKPPAQAVDLGQFRDVALIAQQAAFTPEEKAKATRLLALIDSKAVGK